MCRFLGRDAKKNWTNTAQKATQTMKQDLIPVMMMMPNRINIRSMFDNDVCEEYIL